MQGITLTTPLLIGALSAAPMWVIILIPTIILVLIILLYKELWSFFTKVETGVILLIILTVLSIVGGLLPQHLTKADVADELLGLPLPEVAEAEKAAELMEVPKPADVPPAMLARMLSLPDPEQITVEEAAGIMGMQPPPGMAVEQVYSSWLVARYSQNVIAKYQSWFQEKVNGREQPFKTFYKIGFFMIYHTWYYLLIAYLLFATVVCCTINRIVGFVRMERREPFAWPQERLKRQVESVQLDLPAGEAADAEKASGALKAAGFSPKACSKEEETGYQFVLNFGFKFPFVMSSAIFHLAIFIALIGLLATGYYSWRDSIMIDVGGSSEIHLISPEMKMYKWWEEVAKNRGWEWAKPENRYDVDASFEVRCNDYFSEFKPKEDGWYTLKDYKSDLTIIDNGQEVASKIIEVNFPLTYKGIDLFQENVTETGVLKITTPDGETLEAEAGIWGTKLPTIPGLNIGLTGSSLVWGSLIEESGVSELGPRIRIGKILPPKKEEWPNPGKPKTEKGKGMMGMGMGLTETEWLFVLEDGKPVDWNGYTFLLTGPYAKGTGLQVVKDPGIPILWVSIIVMMVMMVIRAYFPHYTARVDYTPVKDGGRLVIAGRALGLSADFHKQAERIASILRSK